MRPLTGRVVDAKVEADGDIHLALQDADGKNAGKNTHLTSSHVRVRVNSLGKLDRALIFLPVKSPEADPSFMRNV